MRITRTRERESEIERKRRKRKKNRRAISKKILILVEHHHHHPHHVFSRGPFFFQREHLTLPWRDLSNRSKLIQNASYILIIDILHHKTCLTSWKRWCTTSIKCWIWSRTDPIIVFIGKTSFVHFVFFLQNKITEKKYY